MAVPGLSSAAERAAGIAGWLALAAFAVVLGTLASVDAERTARVVVLVAGALFAIGTPHRLFPDPHRSLGQLANLRPSALLRGRLLRWLPVPGVVAAMPAALAWHAGDPLLAFETALAVVAIGLYAFARYAPVGERSGRWERYEAGGAYRWLARWVPVFRFAVPDPLVPGLLLTAEVLLVGAVVGTLGRALGGTPWAAVPAALLALLSIGLIARLARSFDVHAYASDAVWADAFRATPGLDDGRPAVSYDAVYWAPTALRPAVWTGLVSLDRRFPLGRIVAAALGLVVLTVWVGAPAGVRWAALALTIAAATAPLLLTASGEILPDALAVRLRGVAGWTAARSLMAARWLPPVAFVAGLCALFSDAVTGQEAGLWIGLHLVTAVVVAFGVTLVQRARTARSFA